MSVPPWALSLSYWLHMLATVTWIGGLAAVSFFVLPAARQALDSQGYARLLEKIQRRLDPLGWFSLVVLGATGMLQLSSNPNYEGFLAINNPWAVAILSKHTLIFGMVGVSAYMTWGLMPGLRRLALRQSRGDTTADAGVLQRREMMLLRLNLALGLLVLVLTAIARASS